MLLSLYQKLFWKEIHVHTLMPHHDEIIKKPNNEIECDNVGNSKTNECKCDVGVHNH